MNRLERPVDDWEERELATLFDNVHQTDLKSVHRLGIVYQAKLNAAGMAGVVDKPPLETFHFTLGHVHPAILPTGEIGISETDTAKLPPPSAETPPPHFDAPDASQGPKGPAGILAGAKAQTDLAALVQRLRGAVAQGDEDTLSELLGPAGRGFSANTDRWNTLADLLAQGHRILPDGRAVFPAMWDGDESSPRILLEYGRSEGWRVVDLQVQ